MPKLTAVSRIAASASRLESIPAEDVLGIWAEVSPFLKDALAFNPGDLALRDVIDRLLLRDMQLWVYRPEGEVIAALVTEVVQYPRRWVCRLVLFGGALQRCRSLEPDLAAWAKGRGCDSLEIQGRRGWTRALAKTGWREVATVVRKEI